MALSPVPYAANGTFTINFWQRAHRSAGNITDAAYGYFLSHEANTTVLPINTDSGWGPDQARYSCQSHSSSICNSNGQAWPTRPASSVMQNLTGCPMGPRCSGGNVVQIQIYFPGTASPELPLVRTFVRDSLDANTGASSVIFVDSDGEVNSSAWQNHSCCEYLSGLLPLTGVTGALHERGLLENWVEHYST